MSARTYLSPFFSLFLSVSLGLCIFFHNIRPFLSSLFMRLPRNCCACIAPPRCVSCVYFADIFFRCKIHCLSLSFSALSSSGPLFAFVPVAFLHAGYSYGANKTLAYFRLIAPSSCLHRKFSAPLLRLVSFFSGLRYYRSYYTRFGVLILVLLHTMPFDSTILLFCDSSRCPSMKYGVFDSIILCTDEYYPNKKDKYYPNKKDEYNPNKKYQYLDIKSI